MLEVKFNMKHAGSNTMQKFEEIVRQRMKWCNESARGSVAACALDALRSIRAKTKVAKPAGIKPKLSQEDSVYASVTTRGGAKAMCLRWTGSKKRWHGSEKVHMTTGSPFKAYKVFRYEDDTAKTPTSHLFVDVSLKEATRKCKAMLVRRMMRYSGLAKTAVGKLMKKAWTGGKDQTSGDFRIDDVADKTTRKTESAKTSGKGGVYTLTLVDSLRYAAKAVDGGPAQIDTCIKRALNKIVAVINQKIKKRKNDFFQPKPLETPFPELRKRK